MTSDG